MFHKDKFFYIWATFFTTFVYSITRLPCFSYANYNLIPSKYYWGVIESSLYADSVINCGTYCTRSQTCEYANYNENLQTCQLMSSTANSLNSSTISQWTVLTTVFINNTNVGPICEDNAPCGKLHCRDICVSDSMVHAYLCLAESNDVSTLGSPSLSATYRSTTAPSYAIDGNLTTAAMTPPAGNNKWFKLDLIFIFRVYQIIVWNHFANTFRMNGNNLTASINDKPSEYFLIGRLNSNAKQVFTGSYIVRYILITKTDSDALQVAEINVFV
ncbi:uncharacterized protein LOC124809877 [Hydra vulgaris]|uniref:uncharacterized protein LOC124809877 n=1 Tax=Hydra vulgaris TaxID=6087 RepID=UPI000640F4ED